MKRILLSAVNSLGLSNLLLFALLVAGILSVVAGVANLVPGLEFPTLAPLASFALFAGWVLAGTSIRGAVWGIGGLVAGGGYVVIEVGRLGPLFWRWLLEFSSFSIGVLRWAWEGPPDPGPVYSTAREIVQAFSVLTGHFGGWFVRLPDSLGAFDLIIAALIWSFLLWLVSYWAAGVVRRLRRPFLSMVPAGVLLAVSLAYTSGESMYLLPFLSATLLLQVGYRLQTLERRWVTGEVDHHEDIWIDMGAVGVSLVILNVFLAMAAPSFSLRQVVDFIRDLTRRGDEPVRSLAGSLGLDTWGEARGVFSAVQYGGLPRKHLIGTGPELRDEIVMTIRETALFPDDLDVESGDSEPVLYWRSLTYDEYNGRGWETVDPELVIYRAGTGISSEFPSGYRLIRQDVKYLENLNGLLHLAGMPVTVDVDVGVAWRSTPPGGIDREGTPQALEGDIFGIQTETQAYQVHSLVPVPGSDDLRLAGTEYPPDLLAGYLRLPDTVPDRVLALARDLTVTAPTPYDKAIAIETYLRAYTYNLDLPLPPSGVDIADYFLFDLKEGYCDYYATAMVVLARAAGLPARIVMGYAAGKYDGELGLYLVSAADAHSWVEIYFPGHGWIEFEPTGGLPPIERPEAGSEQEQMELLNTLLSEENPPFSVNLFRGPGIPLLYWIGLALSLLVLVLIGGYLRPAIQGYSLKRKGVRDVMVWIFTDIYRQGHRLAVPIEPGDTVYEFAAGIRQRIRALVPDQRRLQVKYPFEEDLDLLISIFVRMLFSPRQISTSERAEAIRTWVRLRRFLMRARLQQLLASWSLGGSRVQKRDN